MIRRASPDDHLWVRTVAADVYRELGDYWTIIGSWLDHPGVEAHIDELERDGGAPGDERRRGFILVGFYQPSRGSLTAGACIADLLAIAVARVRDAVTVTVPATRFVMPAAIALHPAGLDVHVTGAGAFPVACDPDVTAVAPLVVAVFPDVAAPGRRGRSEAGP